MVPRENLVTAFPLNAYAHETPEPNLQPKENKMRTKLIALALALSLLSAQAGNVTVINSAAHPVPVTQVTQVGTAALTENFYSGHITTSATTTVATTTSYVSTIVICVTNAGTGWSIKIQSKEATPTVFYSATAALGTFTPVGVGRPIISPSGIDIITAGTAGVADIKITYSK